MVCRGCGDKKSRYAVGSDVDAVPTARPVANLPGAGSVEIPAPGFASTPAEAEAARQTDPLSAFVAAKGMSYEEMVERKRLQFKFLTQQEEQIMSEMTDAMRRVHIDELISVANFQRMGIPGMTPEQAIVALKDSMERPDFSNVLQHYPGLKEAVDKRYRELEDKMLPFPSNK